MLEIRQDNQPSKIEKGINLKLPGGEFTVYPRKMGFREWVKSRLLYEVGTILADLIYFNDNQYQQTCDRLKLDIFYQPEIPDELWQYRIRKTQEIQMMKQLMYPRRSWRD